MEFSWRIDLAGVTSSPNSELITFDLGEASITIPLKQLKHSFSKRPSCRLSLSLTHLNIQLILFGNSQLLFNLLNL